MRLLLLGLLLSTAASAQTGTITGTVRDGTSGEVLPGANIRVDRTRLGAAADADGRFVIRDVPVGTYDVIASFAGHNSETITSVTVLAGTPRLVDFVLWEPERPWVCINHGFYPPTISRTAYISRVARTETCADAEDDCCEAISDPSRASGMEIFSRDTF